MQSDSEVGDSSDVRPGRRNPRLLQPEPLRLYRTSTAPPSTFRSSDRCVKNTIRGGPIQCGGAPTHAPGSLQNTETWEAIALPRTPSQRSAIEPAITARHHGPAHPHRTGPLESPAARTCERPWNTKPKPNPVGKTSDFRRSVPSPPCARNCPRHHARGATQPHNPTTSTCMRMLEV